MFDRIAVIKTGWCETYDGDMVGGAHANIAEYEEGHERYNFRLGPKGGYFAYTPPIGENESAPSPKELSGWLVFVVAKRPNKPGIYLVGWYENAAFLGEYRPRPEYESSPPQLEQDIHGGQFSYTLAAPSATLIPEASRTFSYRGDHTKRSPVYYLKGNGEDGGWRKELADSLLAEKKRYEAALAGAPVVGAIAPAGGICGDAERRKEVEQEAVNHVRAHYGDDYHFRDRQRDNCGFDLLFTHKESGEEHHVEVKGTAMAAAHFFISRNELAYAEKSPNWRLAMVTDALGQPQLDLMDYEQARKTFEWQPIAWHATLRKI